MFWLFYIDTAAIRSAKVTEAHDNGIEDKINRAKFDLTWRDIPKATLYLFKNPCYICIVIADTAEMAAATGGATFFPKIISNQFSQSLSWSSTLTGEHKSDKLT